MSFRNNARPERINDPNAPKISCTAYLIYLHANNIQLTGEQMQQHSQIWKQMQQHCQIWKQMTDEEKKPYYYMESEDRIRYEKELMIYKCNNNDLKLERDIFTQPELSD